MDDGDDLTTRSGLRAAAQPSRADLRAQEQAAAHGARRRTLVIVLVAVVLLGVVFSILWSQVSDSPEEPGETPAAAAVDYDGPGSEPVQVAIANGATPEEMAETLLSVGVVGSAEAFAAAYASNADAPRIEAGTYNLFREMKAADVVAALLQPENRANLLVEVKPGLSYKAVIADIAKITGVSSAEIDASLAEAAGTLLPAEAEGAYEGWLGTGSYYFPLDATPVDMVRAMIGTTAANLDALGVAPEDRQTVLIKASLVEMEAPLVENRAGVASVIDNRLAAEMTLNLDSTVRYVVGETGAALTPEDRTIDSEYNTFKHSGLPPTPIATVSEESLQAAVSPADTDDRYFVVVNPVTQETQFSSTYTDYQKSLKVLQAWADQNE